MIGSWEVGGLSEGELHYVLADAHLEAAIFLASGLRNGTYPQTFSHAKVIMSLHHHGAELFLKYALSRAGKSIQTTHHLRDLWEQYRTAYPDSEFDFQPPFVTEFPRYSERELAEAIQQESLDPNKWDQNKWDQRTRYHTDRKGHSYHTAPEGDWWPALTHGVTDSYPDEIAGLRDRIHVLHEVIEKRMANRVAGGV